MGRMTRRVKDMPRNQQKAVFAKMIDANYLNRLESAEHAHERLDYLRKKHDLAETTEDKIWGVWNDKKLTHTQKMAAVRQIKAEAAAELLKHQKAETQPTLTGQIRKKKWEQFQKEKYNLEVIADNPVTESTTFERGSQARAERDVIARGLEKHKDEIKEPYAIATNMVKSGAKAEDREAVAKELQEQKTAARSKIYWKNVRPEDVKKVNGHYEANGKLITWRDAETTDAKQALEKASYHRERSPWQTVAGYSRSTAAKDKEKHSGYLTEYEKQQKQKYLHKLSSKYTLPTARKFKEQPSGFWHRKGEMRTLTHSEMTKKQRFEHNISQFPEYKELKQRGADHDYAITKTMQARGIKAPEGKMRFEAEVPPFTLKKKTI